KIYPFINQANTKLIKKLLVKITGSVKTTNIYYLITRILDRKRLGQIDIIFNYSVIAFNIKVGDLSLIITELFNPAIWPKVNEIVE
ncbi:hypothetical protein V2W45_1186292, partial [Cenococcum geophilum]